MSLELHPISIGALNLKTNILQAPLASYSDRAYRHLAALYGSPMAISEMVSVEGLLREGEKTLDLIKRADTEQPNNPDSIPFTVQLFGSKPESFEKATEVLLTRDTVPLIDINAASPVKNVMKTGSGASLMSSPELIGKIVKTIKDVTEGKVVVTVKLRIGINMSHLNYLQCAEEAFKNGADSIALHTRTSEQLYRGKADHSYTKTLKDEFKDKVIIASGDIFSRDDAKRIIRETGADGVLGARGAIGNPFIFSDNEYTDDDYINAFIKHVELHEYYNDSPLKELRKFAPYYLKHVSKNTKEARVFICSKAVTKADFINTLESLKSN